MHEDSIVHEAQACANGKKNLYLSSPKMEIMPLKGNFFIERKISSDVSEEK